LPFIERNEFEVCAQIRTYRNPKQALEFVLFPMVHVAAPEFYSGVREQLASCDYVLYEGIRSSITRVVTSSYRIMAWRPRLGLVEQRKALPVSSMPGTLIHADQSGSTFEAAWADLPLYTRFLVLFLSPLVGAARFLTATRRSIARRLDRESRYADAQPTYIPIDPDDLDRFDEVVLHRRDAHLLSVIVSFYREHSDEPVRAAIVYGASHMEAVASLLNRSLKYHAAQAVRIQVFPL
jgi:hypothetical protein